MMGLASRKAGNDAPRDESYHAMDCAVAAELMDALAVCAMDQLRDVREIIRRNEGSSEWIADVESFDIVVVLMETVRTQTRVIQNASAAIQHLRHVAHRERAADRGGKTAA